MATLSVDKILYRSKAESIEAVKSLQCWGMNLSDVGILSELENLEILNLSCNNLTSLKDIGQCKGICRLYLRKNKISDLNELIYLKNLQNLHSIWLTGNPVSSQTNYRQKVITYLPQLKQLDNIDITDQERNESYVSMATQNHQQSSIVTAIQALLPLLDHSSLLQVHHEIENTLQVVARERKTSLKQS